MNNRILCFLTALALLLPLCACSGSSGPDETTASGTTSASVQTTTAAPGIDDTELGPILSTKLVCTSSSALFVDPQSCLLTMLDRAAGTTSAVCSERAWDEFFLVGGTVYFRSLDTGRICSVTVDGGVVTEYFEMPFRRGLIENGKMFFIDTENYTSDVVLYTYTPASGEWQTTMLTGCRLSPIRDTVVFGGGCLYYTALDGTENSVVRISLPDGARTVLYSVSAESSARVLSLTFANNKLYFHDRMLYGYFCVNSSGDLSQYYIDGDRIFGVLSDGLLLGYSYNYDGNLLLGSSGGQTAECRGGDVLACGQSRALVHRWSQYGGDRVVVVKYPEDLEQKVISGTPLKLLAGADGVVALFIAESQKIIIIDISSGKTYSYPSQYTYLPESVELNAYLAGADVGEAPLGLTPSDLALRSATAEELANVFATAVARSDRYTLMRLLGEDTELAAYMPTASASYTLSLNASSAERAEFTVTYKTYSAPDSFYRGFWPKSLSASILTLVRSQGVWKLKF